MNKIAFFEESILDRGIHICLFLILFTPLLIFILPFGYVSPEYVKGIYFIVLIEVALFLWLALALRGRLLLPKMDALLFLVLLFFAVRIISAFLGFNFSRSFWGAAEFGGGLFLELHFLIFFILLASIFSQDKEWKWLLGVLVLVAGGVSFTGILQKFGLAEILKSAVAVRSGGTLGNPVYFAGFLAPIVFLALYLLRQERNKPLIAIWSSSAILIIIALFFSASRAALLGLAAGFIIFAILSFAELANWLKKQKRIFIFSCLLFVIFLGIIFLLFAKAYLQQSFIFKRLLDLRPEILNNRLPAWDVALRAFKDKPFLGWGPYSFAYLYQKYFISRYYRFLESDSLFFDAHNKALNLLAETGIIGAFVWIAIVFLALLKLFYNRKRLGLAAALLIAFFFSNLVQDIFSFDTISSLLSFFLILAFARFKLSSGKGTGLELNIASPLAKSFLFFAIFILALVSFFGFFRPLQANYNFLQAILAGQKGDVAAEMRLINLAEKENVFMAADFARDSARHIIPLRDDPGTIAYKNQYLDNSVRPLIESSFARPDTSAMVTYEVLAAIAERRFLLLRDQNAAREMENIANRALGFNGQWSRFYGILGAAKLYQQDENAASEAFVKELALVEGRNRLLPPIYMQISTAYLRAGNLKEAASYGKKAADGVYEIFASGSKEQRQIIAKNTKMLFIFENVAAVLWREGNKQASLELYDKLTEMYPAYSGQILTGREKLEKIAQ